jgi:hypothetical protein
MVTDKQRAEIKRRRAINAAWSDLTTNGMQGRTLPEIADQYKANLATLKSRLIRAGLKVSELGSKPTARPTDEAPAEPTQTLANQEGCGFPTKSIENRGNEGDAPGSVKAALSPQEIERDRINRLLGSKLDAALLALGDIPLKSMSDIARAYQIRMETLGFGKGSSNEGGTAQLIQVSILSGTVDSRARPERIMESGNETPAIEAETSEA